MFMQESSHMLRHFFLLSLQLWSAAVEKNDRSWMMVLCFLLTTAVGLLSIVAYKLDVLKELGILDQEEISPGELEMIAGPPSSTLVQAPDVSASSSTQGYPGQPLADKGVRASSSMTILTFFV
jgi:hypothetical protein